jgi:5-methylcytosine-specific restriction endonuclease McrA
MAVCGSSASASFNSPFAGAARLFDMKLCSKCSVERPLSGFKRDRRKPSGFASICKTCSVAEAAKWRGTHKEHVTRYTRERDARYAIERRARKRKPRKQATGKRPSHAAYQKAWEAANPQKMLIIWRNKRAKRAGAEGTHTRADIERIERAQKSRCAYCRTKLGRKRHVDHIQPIARGGSNWPHNLQLLCVPCNMQKLAQDPVVFAQTIGLLV